jgi:hypothetical protein
LIEPNVIEFTGSTKQLANMDDTIVIQLSHKGLDGKFNEYVKLDYQHNENLNINTKAIRVSFDVVRNKK